MYENTRTEILQYLIRQTQIMDFNCFDPFTAKSISDFLNISRNLASQYLNQFVKEDWVIKINCRPVYFLHRETLERMKHVTRLNASYGSLNTLREEIEKKESSKLNFSKAVGCHSSLSYCIDQCKASIKYPPDGIPVAITGAAGTGKSFLARLTFEYTLDHKILPPDTRYLVFDCSGLRADSEKLNASFFGEQGYLSRDKPVFIVFKEAHLLPGSFQLHLVSFFEKLEHSMGNSLAPVRIIFTSSQCSKSLFQRQLQSRIPVTIILPGLSERMIQEKEELILAFLSQEKDRLRKELYIANSLYQFLLSYDFTDHITGLKNCVRSLCANAFLNHSEHNSRLVLYVYHLPDQLLSSFQLTQEPDKEEALMDVGHLLEKEAAQKRFSHYSMLLSAFQDMSVMQGSPVKCFETLYRLMNQYYDFIMFQVNDANLKVKAFSQIAGQILDSMVSRYNIHLSVNAAMIVSKCLYHSLQMESLLDNWMANHEAQIKDSQKYLERMMSHHFQLSGKVADLLFFSLGIKMNPVDIMFFSVYIHYSNRIISALPVTSLIICHGYSTASSIADVVNRVLGNQVFQAIDMPLDTGPEKIVEQVKTFIQKNLVRSELLILVDMGSLESLGEHLSGISGINVGIINGASTSMALRIGSAVLRHKSMGAIFREAAEYSVASYRMYPNLKKEEAILIISENSIETTEKIASLFLSSLPRKLNINIQSYDYFQLAKNGLSDSAFEKYNVLFICGTIDPNIPQVPFVYISDLISQNNLDILDHILEQHLDTDELRIFNNNILRDFTLQNLIEQLIILEPKKLILYVQDMVERLQYLSHIRLNPRLLISLYLHISCMVERLVTHDPISSHEIQREFEEQHDDFIRMAKESFNQISVHYGVSIPVSEIAYLYEYFTLA